MCLRISGIRCGVNLSLQRASRMGSTSMGRRLTSAEKALIGKMAMASSQGVLTPSRPRVAVADEVDEQGRVQWTTSVALDEVLPTS